jgi:WD40 repeat protein
LNLWDLATGKVKASINEGDFAFQVVAFAPDGHTLATGGIDRQVSIWQVAKLLEQKAKDRIGQ